MKGKHMVKDNKNLDFELDEGEEYIELISLLKYMNIASTGGQAKLMVENNEVYVDGELESRKRRKVKSGMTVTTTSGYKINVK